MHVDSSNRRAGMKRPDAADNASAQLIYLELQLGARPGSGAGSFNGRSLGWVISRALLLGRAETPQNHRYQHG